MSQGVVDLLEVVQVDEQDRQLFSAAVALLDLLLEPVAQHAPVGQAGQAVEIRLLPDLRLRVLAVGDAGVGSDHARGAAQRVAVHDHAARQDPFEAAVLAPHAVFVDIGRRQAVEVRPAGARARGTVLRMDALVKKGHGPRWLDMRQAVQVQGLPGKDAGIRRQVAVPDAIAGALQRQFPAHFARAQRLFGVLGLGDVLDRAFEIQDVAVAVAVAHHRGVLANPPAFARLVPVDLGAEVQHPAVARHQLEQRRKIGMQHRLPRGGGRHARCRLYKGVRGVRGARARLRPAFGHRPAIQAASAASMSLARLCGVSVGA